MWREPDPYPIATGGVGGDMATVVQALLENADRLQLTWRMLPATVTQRIDNSRVIVATDGLGSISAVSMVGRRLGVNERVMVLLMPNSYLVLGVIGAKPMVRLSSTAAQSIPNNVTTPATFTTIDLDTHTGFNAVLSATDYIVPESGWYMCTGGATFAGNVAGRRMCTFLKNGATPINGSQNFQSSGITGATGGQAPSTIIPFTKNDRANLGLYQDSGGALSTNAGAGARTWMAMQWVNPL